MSTDVAQYCAKWHPRCPTKRSPAKELCRAWGVGEEDDVPYRNYPQSSAAWLYSPTICRWRYNKTNPIESVDVEKSGAKCEEKKWLHDNTNNTQNITQLIT